jgi:hypothetical protein
MNFDKVIKLPQTDLKRQLNKELKANGYIVENQDGFLYAKGTIPVLLVAHMDTVHRQSVSTICKSSNNIWMAPEGIGGDDRCGIYSILQIIRHYNCHVLFTEDEEIGCVGAKKFTKSGIKPDVNFIIELDRKGKNDCVFYSCDNPDFTKFIESYGFKTDFGSCSDISNVAPYIGKAAVNLSCGYYNAHTQHEYIVIDEMWNTIRRVEHILDDAHKSFDYIEKKYERANNYTWHREEPNRLIPLNTDRKEYDIDAIEVADVLWCDENFADDFFVMHDKSSDMPEIMSITEYGISPDGKLYYEIGNDKVAEDTEATILSCDGTIVTAKSLYDIMMELYFGEEEI